MEYIVSISSQTKNFLFSLGFGAVIGAFYDFLRIVRICISDSLKILYIFDFLFVFVSAVATFLFCLGTTDGEIRLYIILGEILGFLIYYFSFGIIAVRFSEKTVLKIKTLLSSFFARLLSPFGKLIAAIGNSVSKMSAQSGKSAKKLLKKTKMLLQRHKALLYNLDGKMHNYCKKAKQTGVKKQ